MHTTTSRDGTTIAYDREGEGDPLVLVGGAFSYRRYPGQVDWLKADYDIGHGHATALVGYALVQRAAGTGGQAGPQPEGTGGLPLTLAEARAHRNGVVALRCTLGHGTVAPTFSEVSQCAS
jgi:hypothetical protein